MPVTATDRVEELAAGSGLRIRRTPANAAALTAIAATDGVLLAADDDGRVARGGTLPADDALAAVALLLELWVPEDRPLSALVGELPPVNLVHDDVHCPWAAKGAVMRTLIDEAKGYETDNLDGLEGAARRGLGEPHAGPGSAPLPRVRRGPDPGGLGRPARSLSGAADRAGADAGVCTGP